MNSEEHRIFFSVILPVFNTGKRLKKAIQSVIDQSFKNWELIIIDDGCSDSDTLEILNSVEKSESGIRVLRQENQGVSAARNNGLRNAKGKYVMLLDADDYYDKDLLQDNRSIIENSEKDVDIIMREMLVHYENDGTMKETRNFSEEKQYERDEKWQLIESLFHNGLYSNKGGCYSRQLITDNHLYYKEGVSVCEDIDWHLRQMLGAHVIYVTKQGGYNYCLYKRDNWETIGRYQSQIEMSEYWSTREVSQDYPAIVESAVRNRLIGLFIHFSIALELQKKEDRKAALKLCKEHCEIANRSDSMLYKVFYYSIRFLPAGLAMAIWKGIYRLAGYGNQNEPSF